MKQQVLQIHADDNVLVALETLPAGAVVQHRGSSYTLLEEIPAKHKFFMDDMPEGAAVRMYGVLIGTVLKDVKKGSRMTTTNTHHAV
ncbi:MAG TPA: UxaA family hydrolase, partial [Lacibacter sp.]|nr:UxaA family hydrolase [Lacibacter sp.]